MNTIKLIGGVILGSKADMIKLLINRDDSYDTDSMRLN